MPSSLALPYKHYTTAQLGKFAARRGLAVVPPSPKTASKKAVRNRRRRDLLEALEQADANWRFRFFDLPGELRNRVYSYLLTSRKDDDDSIIACCPQILATCEQANEEGTGILYGENTIEIRITPDGVFANGNRCGSYKPILTRPIKATLDFSTIKWPEYLRLAWHIRIEAPNTLWQPIRSRRTLPSGGSFAALSNSVYSLSEFLAFDNELRECAVVFHFPNNSHILGEDWWKARLGQALDPVRLLSNGEPHPSLSGGTSDGASATKWDDGLPRLMEDVLCDGLSLMVKRAFQHGTGLHSAVSLVLRLLLFVPCLLAVLWCKNNATGFEQKLAEFLCGWYGEEALVWSSFRHTTWRTLYENGLGLKLRNMDEKAVLEETELMSRQEIDCRLFVERYGREQVLPDDDEDDD